MTSRAKTGIIGQAGDHEHCLTALYDEYYVKIARYVYTRIGNTSEAEDIASEVFLKALDSLDRYQDRGLPMQAWLFKIAHNLVVDYFRSRSKYTTLPIDAVEIVEKSDPAEKAEISLEIERVTLAMQSLTEEQREVVNLRFFGGLTSREVGAVLNKKDGAVREMQRAAMEKLRHLLGEAGRSGGI
jgi:RNA polymerase sigma-70 factor (ECF subfamily)